MIGMRFPYSFDHETEDRRKEGESISIKCRIGGPCRFLISEQQDRFGLRDGAGKDFIFGTAYG